MDITFEKSDLVYSLGLLQGVSTKNDAMPILSNLMIEASLENGIQFTGNNLECGVKTEVEGTTHTEGKVIVNSKRFLDMVKELDKGDINIKVDAKHRLNISSGKGKYKIIGNDAEEFPSLSEVESDKKLSVDALSLNQAIQRVSFAAHTDADNPLNSIHFKFKEDRTEVAATRRSILSVATLPPFEDEEDIGSLTIPMQAIREIGRVFTNSDEISTHISEGWLTFTDNTSTLMSRVDSSEPFPDYERLMTVSQSKNVEKVTLMKDLLISSLKKVLVLSDPSDHSIKLIFHEDSLQLTSNGPEIGDADNYTELMGPGFEDEIAVDGNLLLTALGRTHTETVEIIFCGQKKPIFVSATSDDVENLHRSLIMSMRITDK